MHTATYRLLKWGGIFKGTTNIEISFFYSLSEQSFTYSLFSPLYIRSVLDPKIVLFLEILKA